VLLAWELGLGLGHLSRLLRLGEALRREGWEVVLAAQQPASLAQRFLDAGIMVLPAPNVPLNRHLKSPTSFADILAVTSFRDPDLLLSHVLCWEQLLGLIKPDVIVGDFSPILALTVYGRIPFVAVGTGFAVLPGDQREFPLIRQGRSREAQMTANVAEVQTRRGLTVPPTLSALVAGDESVVATLQQLDVYGRLRPGKASGPIADTPTQMEPAAAPRVFVYLDGDLPVVNVMLGAVARLRLPARAYLRGAGAIAPRPGVEILRKPAGLDAMLRDNTLIIHHGGCGTAEQCLLAGRAQLLLPRYDEQVMTARQLERLGVGLVPPLDHVLAEEDALRLVADGATSAARHDKAQQRAAEANARRPWTSIERVAEACARLAA
jgi:UDP:flavonoid glycosyltransferase YjiC (YdhE family)